MSRKVCASVSVALAGLLLAASTVWADITVRVVTVHDGDRLTIYHSGKTKTLFIQDIDCPELKQPYGKQAKRTTAAFVGGRQVILRSLKRDAQGKTTAEVILPDGRNVGHELLKEGLAWWKRSGSRDRQLEEVEELARAARKGLWAEPNPMPPWKWKSQAKTTR